MALFNPSTISLLFELSSYAVVICFDESNGFSPAGPGKHFGECEDATTDAPLGSKCDILNDDGTPNP